MVTVTNEEAADIIISNLQAKGFGVINRDSIIADIKAIREKDKRNKRNYRQKRRRKRG